jgi:hypothetical protein
MTGRRFSMTKFDLLWQALQQVLREPPGDLVSAVGVLPEAGRLPSPWATWTLIGLVRHRRRQLWVAEVVTDRLGGDLEAIAHMGAFGHPADRPQHGLVPGLTDWEYYFHGKGCCLTHRGTGEAIDVDFFERSGEYFDVFFYLRYLQSLRNPEAPEARLIALHPSSQAVRLAVSHLLEAGMLVPREGRGEYPFRIAEEVLEREETIDAFCVSWGSPDRRVWPAALVGDWPAAHELALGLGDQSLIDLTAGRAAGCRSLRCRELLTHWGDEERRGEVLLALDDLEAACLDERLAQALMGPIGGVTSRAVQIIQRRDDPAWCPALYQLIRRLDPGGALPQPFLWAECQRFLLRHGHCADEMRRSLPRAAGIAVGEAALLALEHDPGRALPLFRRALRSDIPANRAMAAAILALVDRPWSRRELLAVLQESNDQEATADCRAALLECHDEEAQKAVLAWEEANPYESEPGPWITIGEVMLRNRPQRIRWEIEKLHDRVMKVRDREPRESIAPGHGAMRRVTFWILKRLTRAVNERS